MKSIFRARSEYHFDKLAVGETKKIKVPKDDPNAGTRALCAAYAYARRSHVNAKKRTKFAGRIETLRGVRIMNIIRVS